MFNQIFNRPCAAFDASCLCWLHAQRLVCFAKVVISEIERDRSFKVFKLFAESVCKTREAAAVHIRVIEAMLLPSASMETTATFFFGFKFVCHIVFNVD